MPVRLGELVLRENLITPARLQQALDYQRKNGGKLSKIFVDLGFVKDEHITTLLSVEYNVSSINLDHFEVDPAIIKIIPAETVRKYQVLPLSRSGATLTIAMADPTNVFAIDDIRFMTGYNVEPVMASESALEDAIERYYDRARWSRQRQAAIAGALDALESARPIPPLTTSPRSVASSRRCSAGPFSSWAGRLPQPGVERRPRRHRLLPRAKPWLVTLARASSQRSWPRRTPRSLSSSSACSS